MRYLSLIFVLFLGAGGGIWIANHSGEIPTAESAQTSENADFQAAMQAFQGYTRLINAYDASYADSYARAAVVHLTVHHASGATESGFVPIDQLKANAQKFVDASRQAGETYNFSNLRASPLPHGVRIDASLKVNTWRGSYPYTADLFQDPDGAWKIGEEWMEGSVP